MAVEILSSAAEHSSQDSSCASTATAESGAAHPPAALVAISDKALTSQPASPQSSLSSRLKGVVRQSRGRWGAQIYERHSRVWLGTFTDEDAAARVYDVAAIRFRGREATTNFPCPAEAAELAFLAGHSKAEIVDMLRNHTYADELRQGLRLGKGGRAQPTPSWARENLFEKAVTLSDVGKLNRLVVPKQHAEKHFPPKCTPNTEISKGNGVLLNFEDGEGKVWRFRYSYWDSSQSYVLTKGWSRFVREKGLKAGDSIVFSCSAYGTERQLFIDCKKVTTTANCSADSDTASASPPLDATTQGEEGRVLRLFGVDITEGKRGRAAVAAAEQGSQELFKRQCVAHGQHSGS